MTGVKPRKTTERDTTGGNREGGNLRAARMRMLGKTMVGVAWREGCQIEPRGGAGLLVRVLFFAAALNATAGRVQAQATTVDQLFPLGVQVGTTATIKAGGKHEGQTISWWSNCPGLTFAAGEKPGQVKMTAAADAKPGLYVVRAIDAAGASKPLPFAVGLVPGFEEVEPNNKSGEATAIPEGLSIATGVVADGVLGRRGDVDHFAVSLEAGQTLIAAIDANQMFDAPMDSLLQILSPQGVVLEQNHDDRGLDPLMAFTATEAGIYRVRIMAYPSQPDTSIALAGGPAYVYRLLLSVGPVVSHRLPVARGAAARSGVLVGWNLPAGGETVTLPVAAEPEPVLPFPDVALFQRYPSDAALAAVLVEGDEAAKGIVEMLPASLSGTIVAAGEADEFRFAAAKGTSLRVKVQAREFDSALDPVVQFRDAAGKVLKETDDESRSERDIETTISAPDGPLSIRVFDRFDKGGPRYFYAIDARADVPDFTLSIDTHTRAIKPGEKAEIKVAVARRGAVKGPIVITAEGLPAGVTATPVKSEETGPSSKEVTLVVEATAEAQAIGVPIRIVGATEGEGAVTRTATLGRVGLIDTLGDYWLTVTGK